MNEIEWENFRIADIFEIVKVKGKSSENYNSGNTPYISTSSIRNGLSNFIESNSQITSPSNVLSVDPINGTTFYHPYEFVGRGFAGSAINLLKSKYLNESTGLFLAKAIEHSSRSKSSYGVQLNGARLAETLIWLPVDSNKEPDWKFMESCIKKLKLCKEKQLPIFLHNQLKIIGDYKDIELIDAKWHSFILGDITSIKNGVRLTKNNMNEGSRPFIGASDSNNGITNFVSNINNSLGKKTLGINYNGSVGEGFYHPYEAIFSDDVKQLNFINGVNNEFTLHFLRVSIHQQSIKFGYAYKFNSERMAKLRILLPADSENKIDYDFMENYIKGLKAKKIQEVLKFLS